MSTAQIISKKIAGLEEGKLFSYQDFMPANRMETIAGVFSRLASKGVIKRFGKGKYYKPKSGAFGEIPLQEEQVLESILHTNGNQTGYLTGAIAYNRMGLTSQIANEYIIAVLELRKPLTMGRIKLRFVKSYCEIEKNDIPLLQLLDAVKDIRSIPGTEPEAALSLIKIKFNDLSLSEQKKLSQLSLSYPPSARALIGALFELMKNESAAIKLYKSLNFLSKYKIGLSEEILPNKIKWRIE
jgi:hypothetical protein